MYLPSGLLSKELDSSLTTLVTSERDLGIQAWHKTQREFSLLEQQKQKFELIRCIFYNIKIRPADKRKTPQSSLYNCVQVKQIVVTEKTNASKIRKCHNEKVSTCDLIPQVSINSYVK